MAIDWDYVAGYFDGEGSVGISKHGAHLAWYNTHLASLEAIQAVVGCGTISSTKWSTMTTKQCYALVVSGRDNVLDVTSKLIPLCLIKRQRLEDAARKAASQRPQAEGFGNLARAGVGEIRRLYWVEGMSQREIGEHYGVTETAVGAHMRRHGIPRRNTGDYHRGIPKSATHKARIAAGLIAAGLAAWRQRHGEE